MKKREAEPTKRELLKAIHEVAESVQMLAELTDRRFNAQEKVLAQHSAILTEHSKTLAQHSATLAELTETLSQHTGALAELLVTTRRLDDERLVEHHRLNRIHDEVEHLKTRAGR